MMKMNSKLNLVIVLATFMAVILVQQSSACDPTGAEMAVRMRIQAYLNMFPNIYDDIRNGRLQPNRPGNYVNPNQQYVQPGQQQFVQPGQQYIQPGQQQFVQPGQQVIPQQVIPQQQQVGR